MPRPGRYWCCRGGRNTSSACTCARPNNWRRCCGPAPSKAPLAEAELDAWQQPATYARTGNRSMVASINQRKMDAWVHFAYDNRTAFEVALRMLDTPFTRKDLCKNHHA